MSMYDKTHYNIVISLQLIKINEKNKKIHIPQIDESTDSWPPVFWDGA